MKREEVERSFMKKKEGRLSSFEYLCEKKEDDSLY